MILVLRQGRSGMACRYGTPSDLKGRDLQVSFSQVASFIFILENKTMDFHGRRLIISCDLNEHISISQVSSCTHPAEVNLQKNSLLGGR